MCIMYAYLACMSTMSILRTYETFKIGLEKCDDTVVSDETKNQCIQWYFGITYMINDPRPSPYIFAYSKQWKLAAHWQSGGAGNSSTKKHPMRFLNGFLFLAHRIPSWVAYLCRFLFFRISEPDIFALSGLNEWVRETISKGWENTSMRYCNQVVCLASYQLTNWSRLLN